MNSTAEKYEFNLYEDYSEDEKEYIIELFENTTKSERIFINSGKKYVNYPANIMIYNNPLSNFFRCNLQFTPNTFKNGCEGRYINSMYRIQTIALDIDYKKTCNAIAKPLDFFTNIIEEEIGSCIPAPSYIEYGNQLRLIYILSKPIAVTKARKMIDLAKIVVRRLSDRLNENTGCNCEAQKINSFYRVPLSINTKTGNVVRVIKYTDERYTLQEIIDEYLPDLPDWYENWKEKRTIVQKEGKTIKLHNSYQLWEDRKEIFKELRLKENIPRELLMHLYAQSVLYTEDDENLMEKLVEFNSGFPVPLKKKEILSKFRLERKYKYRNSTINNLLGLDEETSPFSLSKKEKELNLKKMKGESRKQKTEAQKEKINQLLENGVSKSEVAKKLNISKSRVNALTPKIDKEKVIKEWKKNHPQGSKNQCTKELGFSKHTIIKYWN